nr:glycosyltransferase family 4 protein [Aridibaculum aurantiacum]
MKLLQGAKTVCHVHELEYAIKHFVGQERFRDAIPYIDHFLAASYAVKDNLVKNYKIPASKVTVHYEYIPVPADAAIAPKHDVFTVCGSGTLDWRKGIDIMMQVALVLKHKANTSFKFLWIGGEKGTIEYERAKFDLERMGLTDVFELIETCTNPHDYIRSCDLFFLTSREDPFPLVCLEAAALGLPIMCFDKAGGMIEFVNENNGWVVPYLDVNRAAATLLEVMNDRANAKEKGVLAQKEVSQYDIIIGEKKLSKFLLNLMNGQHSMAPKKEDACQETI